MSWVVRCRLTVFFFDYISCCVFSGVSLINQIFSLLFSQFLLNFSLGFSFFLIFGRYSTVVFFDVRFSFFGCLLFGFLLSLLLFDFLGSLLGSLLLGLLFGLLLSLLLGLLLSLLLLLVSSCFLGLVLSLSVRLRLRRLVGSVVLFVVRAGTLRGLRLFGVCFGSLRLVLSVGHLLAVVLEGRHCEGRLDQHGRVRVRVHAVVEQRLQGGLCEQGPEGRRVQVEGGVRVLVLDLLAFHLSKH